jgi:glycosyltransferase EpsF
MSEKRKKIIVQVMSALHFGGAENFVVNLYKRFDTENYHFIFISHNKNKNDYEKELSIQNSEIVYFKPVRIIGYFRYVIQVYNFFKKKGNIDILHSHIELNSHIYMFIGFLFKVGKRITHSHSTNFLKPNNFFNFIYSFYARILIVIFSNTLLACGKNAGLSMFFKFKFTIVNNGVDLNRFKPISGMNLIRNYYNVDNSTFIISQIGRLQYPKNQEFTILISKFLKKLSFKHLIVFFGEGEDKAKLVKLTEENSLEENVKFYGNSAEIYNMMNSSDLLLLPSLYEGFPFVLVESQACGKKSFISSSITTEVDFGLNLVEFLSINYDKAEHWANEIIKFKNNPNNSISNDLITISFTNKGFDIIQTLNTINKLYQ